MAAKITIGNTDDLYYFWNFFPKIGPLNALEIIKDKLNELIDKLGTPDFQGAATTNGTVNANFSSGEKLIYTDSQLTYTSLDGVNIILQGSNGLLTRLPSNNIQNGLKNATNINFNHAVVFVPNDGAWKGENIVGTSNLDGAISIKWDGESTDVHCKYTHLSRDVSSDDKPLDIFHIHVDLNEDIRISNSDWSRTGLSKTVSFFDNSNKLIFTLDGVDYTKSNDLLVAAFEESTPETFIRVFLSGNNTLQAQNTSSYIDGMDGNDSINGGLGNDTLIGSNGNDTVAGGAGNDKIVGGHGAGDDKYDGGTGIDTATYTSALAGLKIDLTKTSSTVTSIDGHDAAGIGTDALKNIENIVAGDFNDNILGSTIANNLFGGAGNDTINGNTGKDTLTGGLGADVFVFNTALNASTNLDTITDFTPKEDSISLKKSIFSKLSVDSNQHVQLYQSIALPTSSKVGYLVYNAANGELAYDADGSAGKAPVKIAIVGIDTHPALSATDFSLV